jgi:lipoate-protein ligase A
MQRLLLTLPTPAENVALDEALLEWAEEGPADTEVLRIWESPVPFVVAGRSSRVEQEIDVAECDRRGISVLRRSSGGAAIVAGPGCLMYAVVLSFAKRPELRDITRAHKFVLDRLASAICTLGLAVRCAGTSDLVIGSSIAECGMRSVEGPARSLDSSPPTPQSPFLKKFSGNSLRVKRTHLLYHGTLLYDFDLPLIARCLKMPSRQPAYRSQRPHADFVANLQLERKQLVAVVDAAFPTAGELVNVPTERVQELVAMRFARYDWNRDFV